LVPFPQLVQLLSSKAHWSVQPSSPEKYPRPSQVSPPNWVVSHNSPVSSVSLLHSGPPPLPLSPQAEKINANAATRINPVLFISPPGLLE
jgi:hypothetical protein